MAINFGRKPSMQLDTEDFGGLNKISGLDDFGGTSLSTQPQSTLGALTPPPTPAPVPAPAPLAQVTPQLNTNNQFNPEFFSASSMDDYFAKNPINIDQKSFNNTFGGFDLNGGLKLNPPAEQTRLNDLDKIVNPLTQQILGQNLTDKWSGQGYGSAEANARDMAKIMAGIGITDINQFGKFTKTGINETVTSDGRGGFVDQRGNPVDPKLVTPQMAGDSEGGYYTEYVAPVGSQEVFGNKLTKQEVPNTYSERQTGNFFGGTFEGKGNTGYGVQFDEQGNPYFYTQGASSSDLGKIAPLLAIAQFIPALAPFATAANAAIAASQGNVLGAIAGAAGLGGYSDIANAANFAGAVKSGNPLGIISSGANLGGMDLSGVADASGLGDLNNIGGFNVSDAAKAYRAVKAIQSGDPSAIISTIGGYMQDQNNQRPASPLDSLVPFPTDSSIATRPINSSIDDVINPSDIPSIGANPIELPELPQAPAAGQNQDLSNKSFGSAFAQARASGAKEFLWNGNVYNTNLAPKQTSPVYDSVGGGRGGQGGPTAEELSRFNAVRGNPPQNDFANWASSVFPSAQGSSVPYYAGAGRGVQGGPTSQDLSDYEMQKNLGPYVGYKNAFNMNPKMGDVNQLQDPRTYAAVTGFMGTSPDEQGFSVLHPDYEGIKSAGEAGFYTGVGATAVPLIGQASKGVSALRGASGLSDDVVGMTGKASNVSNVSRAESDADKFSKALDSMMGNINARNTVDKSRKLYDEGDLLGAYRALELDPATRAGLEKYVTKNGINSLPFKPEGMNDVAYNIHKDYQTKPIMNAPDPTRFGPESSTWNNFVLRTSHQFPSNEKVGRLLDDAIDLINSGDKLGSYKLLDSNPVTRKLMTDFARQSGAKEIGPFKEPARIFSPEAPAQYLRSASQDKYSRNPTYKVPAPPGPTIGKKAEGGLASLNKSGKR